MLWFILCVAVLNMAAGFGLALLLAGTNAAPAAHPCAEPYEDTAFEDLEREPTSQWNAEEADQPATTDGSKDSEIPQERANQVAAEQEPNSEGKIGQEIESSDPESEEPDTEPLEEEQTKSLEEGQTKPLQENQADDDKQQSDDPKPSEEPADSSVMADLDAAVSLALGDGPLPEDQEASSSSSNEETPENQQEDALGAYRSQLENFCEELAALDDHLRKPLSEETADLKSQLDSVAECSQKQDEACKEVEQSLRGMMDAETIDEKQGNAMIAALQEERQEAAVTLEAFAQIGQEENFETQCDQILDQTAKLLDANHDLRDQVSDMIATVQDADSAETTNAAVDALTDIMSRAALDATLAEHWEKDPHHARAVSLTIIDLDHFAKFNRSFGPTVGNRVLRALAQLLETDAPSDCHLARFAGQSFALLSIDRDLKQAVSDAERVRQTIETVQFEYGDQNLEITVSCGVVAAAHDDTQATLYARAVESVREAKRYGRNRTFVHEGEYPTPVVPPNFTLNEKHVTV